MAQIIKHKRGSLESLSAATGSAQKGELLIATGSSNITTTNGASFVYAAIADGQVEAVNRILLGADAPPTFSNTSYNGLVKGVPYYSSNSASLYLLGTDTNTVPNLVGNISAFSSSVHSTLDNLQNQISNLSGSDIAANLADLNSWTQSYQPKIESLIAATASYETKGRNIVSSSSDTSNVAFTISSGVISANLKGGVVSGSSQVTDLLPTGVVSGSSQINGSQITNNSITIAGTSTALGGSITLATITGASGIVSGSSQITALLPTGVVSGSSQVTELLPIGTVSGSSQITYSNISGIPANIVSSSAQVTAFLPTGTVSSSAQIGSGILSSSNTDFATYTGSVSTQLANISNITGSYATTGSNTFVGTQIISGSTYITGDLVVIGSSSISNISASSVSIGTNTVVLNTFSPAVRFGGISVYDSGSTGGTGSLWWDSVNNHWVYEHPADSEDSYNSAMLISGPKNSGSLGNETGLTTTYFPVAVGDDHIQDSNMTLVNGKVTVTGMFEATAGLTGSLNGNADTATKLQTARTINGTSFDGTADITIPNLVSGSSQITYSSLSGIPSGIVSGSSQVTALLPTGTVSGSSQIDATQTTNWSSGIKTQLNSNTVVSGSSQIDATQTTNWSSGIKTQLDSNTVVSGSSQIDATATTNWTSGIKTQLNSNTVVSGSSQITYSSISGIPGGIVSGSSQITYSSISGIPGGIVSGSSQVTAYLPTGVVSGSSQIDGTQITNNSITIAGTSTALGGSITLATITGGSGIISGSGQLTGYETTGRGIVSSSAQVTALLPTGTVSSSAQIGSGILSSSNTDFATYTGSVNNRLTTLEGTGTIQGVGTTNSPTFANLVLTGDLTVQGNTVTLNTTELVVEDKLITLASGSTSAAAANGAGISIDGANATFTYDSTSDAWTFNKPLSGSAVTASINVPGYGSSKRVAFRNTTGNIDFVAAPTTSGDLVQWNGTDFVMSNTIDGGTF